MDCRSQLKKKMLTVFDIMCPAWKNYLVTNAWSGENVSCFSVWCSSLQDSPEEAETGICMHCSTLLGAVKGFLFLMQPQHFQCTSGGEDKGVVSWFPECSRQRIFLKIILATDYIAQPECL
jgi:hypothetical protein